MIITTTPSIENSLIIEYLEPILVNKTVNIIDFREWAIGIQNSKTALKGMDKLKNEVFNELKKIGESKNADAIVSISFDYDEIGGKNGGILMLSASGTPVILQKNNTNIKSLGNFDLIQAFYLENNSIHKLDYEVEIKRRNIDQKILEKYYSFISNKEIMNLENDVLIKNYILTKDDDLKREINYREIDTNHIREISENIAEDNDIFIKILYEAQNIEDFKNILNEKFNYKSEDERNNINKEFIKVFTVKRMYGLPIDEFKKMINSKINF